MTKKSIGIDSVDNVETENIRIFKKDGDFINVKHYMVIDSEGKAVPTFTVKDKHENLCVSVVDGSFIYNDKIVGISIKD